MTLSQWGTVALIASIVGAFMLWVAKVSRAFIAKRRAKLVVDIEQRVTEAVTPLILAIGVRIDEHMKTEEQEREGMAESMQSIREDVATIAGHVGAQLRSR